MRFDSETSANVAQTQADWKETSARNKVKKCFHPEAAMMKVDSADLS